MSNNQKNWDKADTFCQAAEDSVRQGDFNGAIDYCIKAVSLEPDYSPAHELLGAMLLPMMRIDEAEHHCREVIRLGTATANTYFNLAIALGNKCEMKEAVTIARKVLENSPDGLIASRTKQFIKDIEEGTYIGGAWMETTDSFKDEEDLLVCPVCEDGASEQLEFSNKSSSTVNFNSMIGQALEFLKAGQDKEARLLAHQISCQAKKMNGITSPAYVDSLLCLAKICEAGDDYAQAIGHYEEALAVQRQIDGPCSKDISAMLNNMAMVYQKTRNYQMAEQLFEQIIRMDKILGQEDDTEHAVHLLNFGIMYVTLQRRAMAIPLIRNAKKIFMKNLGTHHPYYAVCLSNEAALEKLLTNEDKASQLLEEATKIFNENPIGNEDHINVL